MTQKMLQADDFKTFLQRELSSRSALNPSYSLRAFARDMGVSVSGLSQVLRGRQGVSSKRAAEIADRLGLNSSEKSYLCDLAASQYARSLRDREIARLRLLKREKAEVLALEYFQVIADWYHFALLELTEVEDFKSDPAWIAKALGISETAARGAITRLKKLKLLVKRNGVLRQTRGFVATPTDTPSQAIKKFHQQILQKAMVSIQSQPVECRDLSAIVMPIHSEDIPGAKALLRKLRREFRAKARRSGKTPDSLYCLSTQFFSLREDS